MSLTNIKDVDMQILSYLDNTTLENLERSGYFKEIFEDQIFWKKILNTRFNFDLQSKNVNYKAIGKFLDNNKSLEENYYIGDKNITDDLIKLTINDNPIFLLTKIHVTLALISRNYGRQYDDFINMIIQSNNGYSPIKCHIEHLNNGGRRSKKLLNGELFKIIDNKVIMPDRFDFDLTHKYFDEVHQKPDNLYMQFKLSSPYYEGMKQIEISGVSNLSNGKLLYKIAQSLPKDLVIYDSNAYNLTFDGLYYNDGKYFILDYVHQLINDCIT